jgi:RNA polymerase sigma-70 factor, ECF subfamily
VEYCVRAGRFRSDRSGTIKGLVMDDFARLLEAEIPLLRRYARALARDAVRADDLVQGCLVRALAKRHLWQAGTNLRAWLLTILHNQHVNTIRRAAREGISASVEDVAGTLTVDANADTSILLRDLERAIAVLPEEQRQVVLLIGLEGMHYEDVATILAIPVGTVRSRLSRGRDMLRKLMELKEDATNSSRNRRSAASGSGRSGPVAKRAA